MNTPAPVDRISLLASRSQDGFALVGAGAVYWLNIYPQVRRELRRWQCHANSIPDPVLREQALHKLSVERLNPEGAALFAVLAPRLRRRLAVRLIVAYQLLYDYLDAVNELPCYTDLRDGLRLHSALVDAVMPDQPLSDCYLDDPLFRDGGYAIVLTETCRRIVQALPSAVRIAPVLERAAARCAEAQSRNHAIVTEGDQGLIAWSIGQVPDSGYLWWELAAGGISCLAIHAQFALAAESWSTIGEAELLDAAYFPSVCAISALLDSLADHYRDAGTNNHSFTARYVDSVHAAERLRAITADAVTHVSRLTRHSQHLTIIRGIVAFYLSSPSVRNGFPVPVAENLMLSVGVLVRPMCAVMRLRRRMHGGIQNSHSI